MARPAWAGKGGGIPEAGQGLRAYSMSPECLWDKHLVRRQGAVWKGGCHGNPELCAAPDLLISPSLASCLF